MALIKYGPNISGASGSVGGTTYARNRAGAYMRQRTKPVVPVSLRRSAANSLLSDLLGIWQTVITPAQRTTWDNAAKLTSFPNKLGDAYTPSGCNLFLRSSIQLLNINRPYCTAPPVNPVAPTMAPTMAFHAVNGITLTAIGAWDLTLAGKELYQMSPPMRRSINYFKGPWANLAYQALTDFVGLPLIFLPLIYCVAKSRYFWKFTTVLNDGSVSSPSIVYCDTPDTV